MAEESILDYLAALAFGHALLLSFFGTFAAKLPTQHDFDYINFRHKRNYWRFSG
jgi:hypothetical protein